MREECAGKKEMFVMYIARLRSRRIFLPFSLPVFHFIGLLAAFLVCFCAGHAQAYSVMEKNGHELKWPKDEIPVSYHIAAEGYAPLGECAYRTIRRAFYAWESVESASFLWNFIDDGKRTNDSGSDKINGVQWTDAIAEPSSVGLTAIWYNTKTYEIVEADIFLNNRFQFSDGSAPNKFDLQSVMTHEAGHFFGMAHTNVSTAVMWPYVQSGSTSMRCLHQDDIDGVTYLYPNEDSDPQPDQALIDVAMTKNRLTVGDLLDVHVNIQKSHGSGLDAEVVIAVEWNGIFMFFPDYGPMETRFRINMPSGFLVFGAITGVISDAFPHGGGTWYGAVLVPGGYDVISLSCSSFEIVE